MATDIAPQFGQIRGTNPGNGLGNSGAQDLTGVAGVDTMGNQLVSSDSRKPCYNFSVSAFAAVAAPTAVLVIQGSATRTIRVRSVTIAGAATAAGNMPVVLTKRSSAGTVGSAVLTGVTGAQMDSADVAPTAVVSTVGTANYTTLGTTAGVVASGRLSMAALATGVASPTVFGFGLGSKALVLRGTSQYLTVDFSGATIPSGGVMDFTVQLEEDLS